MALFDRKAERDEDLVSGTDAASRALSVAAVENDFVEGVYDKLAKVYDLTFGPTLHPGRLQAIQRMGITGEDRVLEVGVGTGINLSLYPRDATVIGIDSSSMLEKARERPPARTCLTRSGCSRWMPPISNLRTILSISSTPWYLISVVPDPVKVAQEMRRVCRRAGEL